MKQKRLTRSEIVSNKERLIIENFHRVSKQLGIITENGLVKYAIHADAYSYPNAKHGYYNKNLNQFVTPSEIRKYPKEDFICNIDDVKTARAVAPKNDFNPNKITWEPFYKFEDRFYRQDETGMMADEKWASDGGYYSDSSSKAIISKYDLDLFKKYGNEIIDAFVNKKDDGNFSVNRDNGYAKTIISSLINDFGYPIDYDTEEGETYYWLSQDVSPDELKNDIDTIIHNQYDKVS